MEESQDFYLDWSLLNKLQLLEYVEDSYEVDERTLLETLYRTADKAYEHGVGPTEEIRELEEQRVKLPDLHDNLQIISSFLSYNDLIALCKTNTIFSKLCAMNIVWGNLVERKLPGFINDTKKSGRSLNTGILKLIASKLDAGSDSANGRYYRDLKSLIPIKHVSEIFIRDFESREIDVNSFNEDDMFDLLNYTDIEGFDYLNKKYDIVNGIDGLYLDYLISKSFIDNPQMIQYLVDLDSILVQDTIVTVMDDYLSDMFDWDPEVMAILVRNNFIGIDFFGPIDISPALQYEDIQDLYLSGRTVDINRFIEEMTREGFNYFAEMMYSKRRDLLEDFMSRLNEDDRKLYHIVDNKYIFENIFNTLYKYGYIFKEDDIKYMFRRGYFDTLYEYRDRFNIEDYREDFMQSFERFVDTRGVENILRHDLVKLYIEDFEILLIYLRKILKGMRSSYTNVHEGDIVNIVENIDVNRDNNILLVTVLQIENKELSNRSQGNSIPVLKGLHIKSVQFIKKLLISYGADLEEAEVLYNSLQI